MPRRSAVSIAIATLLVAAVVAPPAGAVTRDASQVRHETVTFVDRSRPAVDPTGARSAPSRTLVTEIYVPGGKGPLPLIVFAHGAAGNPGKLTQLLSAWARAGYVVVAPTFPLTNDATPGQSILIDYVNQPADVKFVLDGVLRQSQRRSSPLYRRVNAHHIGLAGHSLGGATVYGLAFHPCCRDRRVDAVVLLDAAKLPFGNRPFSFRGIPLLLIHIKGDPVVPFRWSQETYAAARAPKYLMTLNQGIHFEPFENTPSPHDRAVIAATTAFWDAYLRNGHAAAKRVVRAGTEAGLSQVTAATG